MLLAIMLFIIGQALNLSTGYWIIWGLWIIVKLVGNFIGFLKDMTIVDMIDKKDKGGN